MGYSNERRSFRTDSCDRSNTIPHQRHYLTLATLIPGRIQNGPFKGLIRSIAKGPISPKKQIPIQTPAQKNHLPFPIVLFSEAQALARCPPANNKKVCSAMIRDHIDDATSPTLIKNPCTLHANPGQSRLTLRVYADNAHPIACTKSNLSVKALESWGLGGSTSDEEVD